jgi:hypothetical protein
MEFLFYIILFYVIYRLISRFIVNYFVNKNRRSGVNDSYGDRKANESPKRKKVFRKDDGEYVDFEEIKKKTEKP